ncbi:diaminopimelate decarboxylase [Neolewinella xylanilytica]|uniref:Diaminopimelate decarboxylase n=1 Tax=Neolewinella xylanilytica TaxID=1514080 RepID=A0A2S6I6A9_9BACT|nr:diaminopimelate decarboxylase [Neolewinella xylanilytica]PPK86706.1 diaminopimelate decarboxylase [Neolewinella xylanilytica]
MQFADGRYSIAGLDLLSVVEEFGAPLYVYDADRMKRQYDRINRAFSGVKRLRINYACKALTNLNILRLFRQWGSGLDTVSMQEVDLGLMAGFDPHDILFTPNCVGLDEVNEAVGKGVRMNIDNISILEQFGDQHRGVPVCIRLNPHIMAGGNSKISVGHIDSKFGISIHQVPHVLKIVNALNLKVEGLHMHTGSDILDAQVFLQGVEILLRAAADFPDLDYIDFGSGFKVPYKEGGIATDIEDLGQRLSTRFNEFCGEYGRELELMFEPGKFLVSEAGTFLVKTNVVKTTPATVFAGVDSGLNHFIRPMFYDAYHHITNISNPSGKPRIYTVVGYICETDTFGINRQLSEVREGDILALANAGAYCFMMSSNYNSRYRPAEVMILDGNAHLIRRRETMEDLLNTQVELPQLAEALGA